MSFSAYPDPVAAEAPIGIFDSGVGALSVLRHIQARLPSEHLLCFADSGYAPYAVSYTHLTLPTTPYV